MEPERTLLNLARKMNKDALVKIFDLYSLSLFKYALRLCNDPVLADHIVGDVFAKLLDQLSAGNGPKENLRSYLYEMTYHQIIDEARYTRRRISFDAAVLLRQGMQAVFTNVEDHMMFMQVLDALQNELTKDQRHVIVLRFLEEFSLRETAAIMGKTVAHVKVIQSRALAKLRQSLEYRGSKETLLSLRIRTAPKSLVV